MKALSISLTLLYAGFAIVGLAMIALGKIPIQGIWTVVFLIVVAFALNGKGGSLFRFAANITTGLLSIMGVFISLYSYTVGKSFDLALFSVGLGLSFLGVVTFFCIKNRGHLGGLGRT